FNPQDSVDMQGQTGPYIQNAFVRIRSIQRKQEITSLEYQSYVSPKQAETDLIQTLMTYPQVVAAGASNYDPSSVANFAYELAKRYHKFYHDVRILSAESEAARDFRLALSGRVADVLEHSMSLLGIEMPERM
ncbi:MAG: DALR anticodon-binding domain-containing protein, partial [Bacteroidota bacterium]